MSHHAMTTYTHYYCTCTTITCPYRVPFGDPHSYKSERQSRFYNDLMWPWMSKEQCHQAVYTSLMSTRRKFHWDHHLHWCHVIVHMTPLLGNFVIGRGYHVPNIGTAQTQINLQILLDKNQRLMWRSTSTFQESGRHVKYTKSNWILEFDEAHHWVTSHILETRASETFYYK